MSPGGSRGPVSGQISPLPRVPGAIAPEAAPPDRPAAVAMGTGFRPRTCRSLQRVAASLPMVRVSRPRAAASRLKAPAFRSEVAAPLPMVQGSPLKVEVSLPMGPMVRASRLMAPVLTVLAQALASQQMAPVLTVVTQAQASQQMAPVLTVLAQAQASQQMAPVQAPPVQAPRQ